MNNGKYDEIDKIMIPMSDRSRIGVAAWRRFYKW